MGDECRLYLCTDSSTVLILLALKGQSSNCTTRDQVEMTLIS